MLELSTLKFAVNSQELDDALTKVDRLATAFGKLTPAVTKAEKETAALAKAQSQAAKAAADAEKAELALANAKEKTANASKKKSDSEKEATDSTKSNITALEKQQQILEFMTQGFSKGQSTVLTMAKATGTLTSEMDELGKVLQTQRKLMGNDPFDASMSGLTSLKNRLGEVREANRLYTAGIELTKTQTRELARDKERIIERMKVEGKSLTDIKEALREHNAAYIAAAHAVNKLTDSEKDKIKSSKDSANATAALAREDQRMISMLETLNTKQGVTANVTNKTAEALANYAQKLRTAGISGEQYTKQLEAHKNKLIELQKLEEKQRVQYVTRAVGPQLTDIFSGLATGQQSLYTILVQQGGQLADQFSLAQVEAGKMGEVLRSALPTMLKNITDIGKAIGTMIVGGFMDAGKAVFDFTLRLTGADKVLAEMTARFPQFAAFTSIITGAIGAGIGLVIAGAAALLVALYQLDKEQTAIAKSATLAGASMGLTSDSVYRLGESLGYVTGNTTKSIAAILAMAEAGGFTSKQIEMIGFAAMNLEKTVGIPVEETVKQFKKLADEPSKALLEVAKSTGFVSAATVQLVIELEAAGKKSEAAALAQKAYASATKEAADTVQQNYGYLQAIAKTTGQFFSNMWDKILGVGRSDNLDGQIKTIKERIATVTTGGVFSGVFSEQGRSNELEVLNAQLGALEKQRKASQDVSAEREKQAKAAGVLADYEQLIGKNMSDSRKYQVETNKLLVLEQSLAGSGLLTAQKQLEIDKQKADLYKDYMKQFKGKKEPKAKEEKTDYKIIQTLWEGITDSINKANIAYDEVVNGVDKYTNSQKKMMDIVNNKAFLAMPESLQQEALARLAIAHATEEQTVKAKDLQKSQDDEIDQISKQFQALKDLAKARKLAYESDMRGYADKLKLVEEESEDLLLQKKIYGQATEQQKVAIEYAKVKRDLEKEILKIKEKQAKGDYSETEANNAITKAEGVAEAKRKNILDASALETYKAYHTAFADAIETGLLDSGKTAGVNLRKFLENELLRKPFRVFINAAVDLAMNSLGMSTAGSVASGAGSSMLGSVGASFLGSSSALSLGAQSGFGALMNGGAFEAVSGAFTAITEGTMASFAAGLGSLAGVLGPIAGVAMLLSSLDDSGTMHTGGLGSYSKLGGSSTGTAVKTQGLNFDLASADYQSSTEKASVAITQGIVKMLDSTASTFGKEAGYYAATAFADDTSKDNSWGALMIKLGDKLIVDWKEGQDKWPGREFADGEAGAKEYSSAIASEMKQILLDMDLPGWANDVLKSLGDSPSLEDLSSAVETINQATSAIKTMGVASEAFAGLDQEKMSSLIAGLGGVTNAMSELGSYYTEFYTEQEKVNIGTKLLTEKFTVLGKELPATRDLFKGMVDTAIAAGDTELASGLISLSGEFAAIVPAAEGAKDAVSDLKSSMDSLKSKTKSLQVQYLEAIGDKAGAKSLQRSFDTEGMTAQEIAQYDYNASLETLISNLKEAKTATNDYSKAQEQALKDQFDTQKSNLSKQFDDQKSNLSKQLEYQKDSLSKLLDSQLKAVDEALSAQLKAYDIQIEAARKQAEIYSSIRSALQSAFDSLRIEISSAKKSDYFKSSALVSSATTTGVFTPGLEDALKVISEDTKNYFSTAADYAFARTVDRNNVGNLLGQANALSADTEAQIAKLEELKEQATRDAEMQKEEYQLQHEESLRKLDSQHEENLVWYEMQYQAQLAQIEATYQMIAAQQAAAAAAAAAQQAAYAAYQQQAQQAQAQSAMMAQFATMQSGQMAAMQSAAQLLMQASGGGMTMDQALSQVQRGATNTGTDQLGNATWIMGDGTQYTVQRGSAAEAKLQAMYDTVQQANRAFADFSSNGAGIYRGIESAVGEYKTWNADFYKYWENPRGATQAGFLDFMGARSTEFGQFAASWQGPSLTAALAALGLPSYDIGTNLVSNDQLAYIHKDEAVLPADMNPFNPAARTPFISQDNSELKEEISLLRSELRANVIQTSKLQNNIDRLIVPTAQGYALSTKAVV